MSALTTAIIAAVIVLLLALICMGAALYVATHPGNYPIRDKSNSLKSVSHDPKVIRVNSEILCKGDK